MTTGRGSRALAFALYCVAVFVLLGEMVVRFSGVATRHFYDPVYEHHHSIIHRSQAPQPGIIERDEDTRILERNPATEES